jgi:SAM-dependent methyltransferase
LEKQQASTKSSDADGAALHPNYEYVLNFIRDHSAKGSKALDYGCGGAELVHAGRGEGLNVYGVEMFYEGGDKRHEVTQLGYLGSVVRELENGQIAFPNGYFDIIVSNMVFEHVENLEFVLGEISRVLRPGGRMLSLFPSRETWFEGHCGVPFLHRFRKGSKPRVYYAFLCRSLGMGYFKSGKTRMQWAHDFCGWLDQYTYYRKGSDIDSTFRGYFKELAYREIDFLLFRLDKQRPALHRMFRTALRLRSLRPVVTYMVRRRACLVIEARKTCDN